MKKAALVTAGVIFFLVSVAHWVRFSRGDEVVVAGFVVPLGWSAAAGLVFLALALWMIVAARD